nr:hypothetical protein CFP56_08064 [Quercus suber]
MFSLETAIVAPEPAFRPVLNVRITGHDRGGHDAVQPSTRDPRPGLQTFSVVGLQGGKVFVGSLAKEQGTRCYIQYRPVNNPICRDRTGTCSHARHKRRLPAQPISQTPRGFLLESTCAAFETCCGSNNLPASRHSNPNRGISCSRLVFKPAHALQAGMADVKRTKRKRAKAANTYDDDDSDESKKRGRPRVEKQDESAADSIVVTSQGYSLIVLQRRRTQIRMAQRAYRQRKESTLEDLRRRVADLTGAVEAANRAFQDCRGRLTTFGLSMAQMEELQKLSQHFTQLTQIVHNEQATSSAPPTILTPPSSSKSHDGEDLESMGGILPELSRQADPSQAVPKYEMAQSNPEYCSLPSNTTEFALEMSDLRYGHASSQDTALNTRPSSSDVHRSMTPESISIPQSLTSPTSYSFHETSFARRLHRAGLEAGYHLLLNRAKRPSCYERIFQLSLLGRSWEKLIASLKSVLDRGPQDSLDFWEAPLLHVGGAGTHYPRRNQFGEIQPKKASYSVGLVGPQTLATLENAARDNLSTDMTVEIAGFEGEWMDPYDVAGYLEERGIFMDHWTSLIEAEVTEWPVSPVSMPNMLSPDHPPPRFSTADRSSAFNLFQLQILANMNADFSKWNDLNPVTFSGVRYLPVANGPWMDYSEPQLHTSASHLGQQSLSQVWDENGMQDTSQLSSMPRLPTDTVHPHPLSEPQKKLVYIDVMRFIKILIVGTVCLGRTQGYRRRDIDRALALSSFDIVSG